MSLTAWDQHCGLRNRRVVHSEARGQTGRWKGLQMQVGVVSQRGGEELSFTAAEPV